jgi:hypothetical protein
VRLLNITMGNPYFNPHVNRPYAQGGYEPPEHPLKGVARMLNGTARLKELNPEMAIICSAVSFLGVAAPHVVAAYISDGGFDFAALQQEYGIACCSYGTYFRLGVTPLCELAQYIKAAKILGTVILRLWCGNKNSQDYTEKENLAYAKLLVPYTVHIHVFNWKGEEKHPLRDAVKIWKEYLMGNAGIYGKRDKNLPPQPAGGILRSRYGAGVCQAVLKFRGRGVLGLGGQRGACGGVHRGPDRSGQQ